MVRPSIAVALGLTLSSHSFAYEVDTHRRLSDRAVAISQLESFAERVLKLVPEEQLAGKNLNEWVQEGSEREDDSLRFFNHFHDPHRPWASAGLKGEATSSVIWAQNQVGDTDASWSTARYFLYLGLTSQSPSTREADLSEAFALLGNQIHFVQDAAVTAHTRDDAHPRPFFDPEPLETHVDKVTKTVKFDAWTRNPVRPDPSLLEMAPTNALTPVPIAHLIDSADGAETPGAAKPGTAVGLAEFTNTNFFSADTILHPRFPFPRLESLAPRPDLPYFAALYRRRYRAKVADGVPVEHFVVEGPLGAFLDDIPELHRLTFSLDLKVVEDYAAILLPRAVGYSAAMIDYFVRGSIALERIPNTNTGFTITNLGAEEMEGRFEVFYDDVDGLRHRVYQSPEPVLLPPGGETGFGMPTPSSPAVAELGEFLVVFRGRLGLEGRAESEIGFAVVADRFVLPFPPDVYPGPIHTVLDGHSHTHRGAIATDPEGDLASYQWHWHSCPAACPPLSGAGDSIDGGAEPVPIPGPTFETDTTGEYQLALTVTDAQGVSTTARSRHIVTDARVFGYTLDGEPAEFPEPSFEAAVHQIPVNELHGHWVWAYTSQDESFFMPLGWRVSCPESSAAECVPEGIASNFVQPFPDLPPGLIFEANSFQIIRAEMTYRRAGTSYVYLRYGRPDLSMERFSVDVVR